MRRGRLRLKGVCLHLVACQRIHRDEPQAANPLRIYLPTPRELTDIVLCITADFRCSFGRDIFLVVDNDFICHGASISRNENPRSRIGGYRVDYSRAEIAENSSKSTMSRLHEPQKYNLYNQMRATIRPRSRAPYEEQPELMSLSFVCIGTRSPC